MRLIKIAPSLHSAARKFALASLIIGIGFALGACSSARDGGYGPSWAGAEQPTPVPQRQAAYEPSPGDPIPDAPIEPRHAPAAMPDDPKEPFSPNYGGPRDHAPARVGDALPGHYGADPEPDRQPSARRATATSGAYYRRTTTASAD